MADIERELWYRMQRAPEQEYHVIVRTEADPVVVAEQCATAGIVVHRRFRLIPALALTGRGAALLALAEHPAVTRIEADRDVTAL